MRTRSTRVLLPVTLPSLSDISRYSEIAGRVAPYKKLRYVEVTDAIPRSPSGKILRRVLAARA